MILNINLYHYKNAFYGKRYVKNGRDAPPTRQGHPPRAALRHFVVTFLKVTFLIYLFLKSYCGYLKNSKTHRPH
jgi:hypothetical protein